MSTARPQHVAEIDGLRAFAVIAVLLFHAFPHTFPGGFIGVDVFFTVSGYVIARTYLDRLISGETSLQRFFLRRVRRLAPAYAVVLASSTVAAVILLDPLRLKTYGVSLLAQPFYLQNVTFWLDGDYFNKAITKPLLHTWSLAVEEQFYLLFGGAMLLFRKSRKLVLPVLIGASALSLLGALPFLGVSPKTPFYLVPFRVWEFAAGILAWMLVQRMEKRDAGAPALVLALAAGGGLLLSTLAFGEAAPFPGPQALLSTISVAVLLVLFETRPARAYAPLRIGVVRRIGELSYSLYLWHWPLIVFAVFALGRTLGPWEATLALAASFVLSELTYRTVEDPVRRKRRFPTTPALLRTWALSSVVFALAGGWLIQSQGALFRYDEPLRSLYAAAQDRSPKRCARLWRLSHPGAQMCPVNEAASGGRPGVLLVGDSHADQLDEVLGAAGDSLGTAVYLAVRNCDLTQFGTNKKCSRDVLDQLLDEASGAGVERVLALSNWSLGDIRRDSANFVGVLGTIRERGMEVVVSETIPTNRVLDPLEIAQMRERGEPVPPYTRRTYDSTLAAQRSVFRGALAAHDGVRIVSPAERLCGGEACSSYLGERPLYHDPGHLNSVGARYVLPVYLPALRMGAAPEAGGGASASGGAPPGTRAIATE